MILASRVVHFSALARGERRPDGRGAIPKGSGWSCCIRSPFVCGAAPPQGWHLRGRGVRMLRDLADQPDRFGTRVPEV